MRSRGDRGRRVGVPYPWRPIVGILRMAWLLAWLSVCACSRRSFTQDLVWADDDAAYLEVRQYQRPDGIGSTSDGTSVIVHGPDGDGVLQAKNRRFDLRSARNQAFHMRSRGYVLLVVDGFLEPWLGALVLDDATGNESWRHGSRYVQGAAEHADDLFLPSPDGAVVAALDGNASDPRLHRVSVEFLDAYDGAVIGTALVETPADGFTVPPHELRPYQWATWTPAGDLLVETVDGTEAVSVGVDGTVTPADYPGCWYPSTTSSVWSSEGESLEGNNLPDGGDRQPFGCQ